MTCGRCGVFLKEENKFCTNCGQAVPMRKNKKEMMKTKLLYWGFGFNVVQFIGSYVAAVTILVQSTSGFIRNNIVTILLHCSYILIGILFIGSGTFMLPRKADSRQKTQGILCLGYGAFQGYFLISGLPAIFQVLTSSTNGLWQSRWQYLVSSLFQEVNQCLLFFLLLGMGISFLSKKVTLSYRIVKSAVFASIGISIFYNVLTFIEFTKTNGGTGQLTYAGVQFNYTNLLDAAVAVLTMLSFLILYRRLAEERTTQSKKDGNLL